MEKYRNFIYLEDYNFVFCYVPKVACTNWKCLFRKLMGFDDIMNAGKAHDRKNSGLIYLNEVGNAQYLIDDTNISKYCFTRNPYSRVLSAYLNKVDRLNRNPDLLKNDYFSKLYLEIQSVINIKGEISFIDFLKWLKKARLTKLFGHYDEHWRNQSDILNLKEVSFDFVGRFENIQTDSNKLFQLIGAGLEFPTQQDVGFPATKASDKLKKYYTEEAISLVNELYFQDFEQLNYYKMKKSVDEL